MSRPKLIEDLTRFRDRVKDEYEWDNGYNEGIWSWLLQYLQLRTLYRVILLYQEANKAISRGLIWTALIRRDLGLVPDWAKDRKLYYLREMHFGVPLNVYSWNAQKDEELHIIDLRVLAENKEFTLHENKIYDKELNKVSNINLRDTSYRRSVIYQGKTYIITTGGQLLDLTGKIADIPPWRLPLGEVICDITTTIYGTPLPSVIYINKVRKSVRVSIEN